jgi:hypothetical protein
MTTPEDVDGAAWRAELERWHAELANTLPSIAVGAGVSRAHRGRSLG